MLLMFVSFFALTRWLATVTQTKGLHELTIFASGKLQCKRCGNTMRLRYVVRAALDCGVGVAVRPRLRLQPGMPVQLSPLNCPGRGGPSSCPFGICSHFHTCFLESV
jgi:hypothetical protein